MDAEPHIQQLILEEFQEEGYEVQVAGSGRDVPRLVDMFHPDVVVLEMLLPDMSGLETGRIVKGSLRNTRIIFYSHCLPPRDLKAWGADDYVFKSYDLERLKQAVRRLLTVSG